MCDECFPIQKAVTFNDFCTRLCDFRQLWSDVNFWRKSGEERVEIIDSLISDFGVMDGTSEQIETAGIGLKAVIVEYKIRNGLRLLL